MIGSNKLAFSEELSLTKMMNCYSLLEFSQLGALTKHPIKKSSK